MNKNFFKNNRKRLINEIDDNSLIVLFAGKAPYKSADETYDFTPNRNFYYMTGIDKQNVIYLAYKKNNEVKELLFIEENDPQMERWLGRKMSISEAKDASGIEDVKYISEYLNCFSFFLNRMEFNNLYLDLERAEWDTQATKAQEFCKNVRDKYPYLKIKNIYSKICDMRIIKSKEEVDKIRKAIKITEDGIYNMMRNVKPGMMEYELEAYFDFTLTKNGVKDKAFKTILAAGKNGATLHYSQNNCKIGKNDLIQLDLGAQYEYYNGDISRSIPANGRFTQRQKQIYNVVLKANKAVIEMSKPGVTYKELEKRTREVLAEGCIELGLIKDKSELSKYYFHSVSHPLGLDTHDVGDWKNATLKEGMVFTDEPGLYILEEGIGIRIEDDILITKDGCEVLTKDMIKEIDEIEEYMNKAHE